MKIIDGDSIRRRRKRMRYTQRDLAALVGCSHAMIGYLERGEITTCTRQLAEKICARLDLDLESEFREESIEITSTVSTVKLVNERSAA